MKLDYEIELKQGPLVLRSGEEITEVCLEGGTRLVYEGILTEEAWQP